MMLFVVITAICCDCLRRSCKICSPPFWRFAPDLRACIKAKETTERCVDMFKERQSICPSLLMTASLRHPTRACVSAIGVPSWPSSDRPGASSLQHTWLCMNPPHSSMHIPVHSALSNIYSWITARRSVPSRGPYFGDALSATASMCFLWKSPSFHWPLFVLAKGRGYMHCVCFRVRGCSRVRVSWIHSGVFCILETRSNYCAVCLPAWLWWEVTP